MKAISCDRLLLLFLAALALLMLAVFPARADTKEAIAKKMMSLIDAHREMLAVGDFARLDAGMNKIQAEYEKGQWTDVQLWNLFEGPFNAGDPAFEELYNKWVAAYPKSYAAHYARGAYYFRLVWRYAGKSDQTAEAKRVAVASLQDYTASLSLTAKPLLTYSQLMGLYALTKDSDKIRAIYDGAVKLDPRNSMARVAYMNVLSQVGTTAEMQAVATDLRKTGADDDEMSGDESFLCPAVQGRPV